MANAKKCDRCNTYFEYEGVELFDAVILQDRQNCNPQQNRATLDLCSLCRIEILEFLNLDEKLNPIIPIEPDLPTDI